MPSEACTFVYSPLFAAYAGELGELFLKSNYTRHLSRSVLFATIVMTLPVQADDVNTLDAVQVTANRSAMPVDDALASVTIITRSDIEQSQASDVYTLLGQQAGIDITRSGGTGSLNSIFLRGSNSNHTLILIDGVRVNSATQGSFDVSVLPIAMIDRIEIVRGPRAALWGSDAIGGVIQFFTRKPSDFVELRVGNYGYAAIDAGLGFGDSERNFGISASYSSASGFSATNPNVSFGFDPDKDGFENRHLQLKGKTLIDEHTLSGFAAFTRAEIEFDQGVTDQDNIQAGLSLSGQINSRWQHNVSIGYNREELETPAFGSIFSTRRVGIDWVNIIELNDSNMLNIGVNWSRENGFSGDSFGGSAQFDNSRRNLGAFAAWRGDFERNQFDVSIRHDDNNQFGTNSSAQAAWGFKVNDSARLYASWGQGFRAPNFNELYYPGFFGQFAGNPNLQPENSNSLELGLNLSINQQQSLEISAYRTRIKNLIAFQNPIDFSAVNINRANLKGFEADYRFVHQTFSIHVNAGWQNAVDATSGAKLLRRADRKLNINTDFTINDQWHWGLDFQAASERPDFGVNAAGYGRVDARLGYRIADNWDVEARIENIGDKDYELIPGFNTPGRSGMLTLRWNGP
jgi:vitamin B12 transporter